MTIGMVYCQTCHGAHVEAVRPGPKVATQQYVSFGVSPVNLVRPLCCVSCVTKVVPGRGSVFDFGVDSATGMRAFGVPRTVTSMSASLIFGFGEPVPVGPGVGVSAVPPLL